MHRIIGIGGLPRSGKDTLAELFMQHGYYGVSLGDIVRDVARERHAGRPDPISVANMTETSNWLRAQKGPDFALKEALARFEEVQTANGQYQGLVVYSVRAPAEVDFIRKHGGEMIWVQASDEVRHARAMQHLRKGETKLTLDEFKDQEDKQWMPQPDLPPEVQMNVAYVKDKATRQIENETDSLEAFKAKAEKLITKLSNED